MLRYPNLDGCKNETLILFGMRFIQNQAAERTSQKCGDSQEKDPNELAIALPILGTYHNSVWETERLLRRDKDPM